MRAHTRTSARARGRARACGRACACARVRAPTREGENMKHLLFLLALFVTASAFADTSPTRLGDLSNTCGKFVLCGAQTATGDCTVLPASGDEIVLETFSKWSSFTLYSNESVGNHTCHIFSNNGGHDAEPGDAIQISTTALSETQELITLNGGNFGFIWANCSAIGTSVYITVKACPSNRWF